MKVIVLLELREYRLIFINDIDVVVYNRQLFYFGNIFQDLIINKTNFDILFPK